MSTHHIPVNPPSYDVTIAPWPGLGFSQVDNVSFTVANDGVIPPDATITDIRITATWLINAQTQSTLQPFAVGQTDLTMNGTAYGNVVFSPPYYTPDDFLDHAVVISGINEYITTVVPEPFFYQALGQIYDTNNPLTGLPWTSLAEILAVSWGIRTGYRTISGLPGFEEPSDPEHFRIHAILDDIDFRVDYVGGTIVPSGNQPTDSVPCCTSSCCETTPPGGDGGLSDSPPAAAGDVLPPETFTLQPACAGGGELPVYEALTDSEVYL